MEEVAGGVRAQSNEKKKMDQQKQRLEGQDFGFNCRQQEQKRNLANQTCFMNNAMARWGLKTPTCWRSKQIGDGAGVLHQAGN